MADRMLSALFWLATLVLLALWPGWRLSDAAPPDLYAQAPEAFEARVRAFAQGRDMVAPAPGDVPVLARRFQFWPELELQKGQSYRLHVSSVDGVHALVVQGREVMLVPGQVRVVDITPQGELDLRCNEYCGLGHNRMRQSIRVVE